MLDKLNLCNLLYGLALIMETRKLNSIFHFADCYDTHSYWGSHRPCFSCKRLIQPVALKQAIRRIRPSQRGSERLIKLINCISCCWRRQIYSDLVPLLDWSLRSVTAILDDLTPPIMTDKKHWLSPLRITSYRWSPTSNQPAFYLGFTNSTFRKILNMYQC